jgi:copper chaperone
MLKLKVDGMTCGHCVQAVTKALARVKGVERVASVDLQSGEAVLEGSPDVAAALEAVKDAGYAARPAA